ncbi:MAG: bile acid:sodium symporter [Betaproteobacteria bacterium]|nr:bile acid:sodium symporter [Betaproteobacteria bacterium]
MLSPLETKLFGVMMMLIMLGMGASLTVKDFLVELRRPVGIGIGMVTTYLLTPLLAVTLAWALQLPPLHAVGLVLMGWLPGGTTSNIFNYYSRGVLSLSILMTVCSTVVAVLMVPLTLALFSSGIDGQWRVPPENVMQVLLVLVVPTLIGLALRRWAPRAGAWAEKLGSVLGIVVIVFLVVSWVPRNWQLLLVTPPSIYAAAIGLGVGGFLVGYAFARLVRQDKRRARTIALETGIQNGPLGILIVLLSFSGARQQEMLLIPVLYSLFILLSSSIATLLFRRWTLQEERRAAAG